MMAMNSTLTIVHLTLREARRRRIATAAMLCGAAFLTVFTTALFFAYAEFVSGDSGASFIQRQATLTVLTLAGLYAANFLCVLFAVLLPVDTLSGEIDSGVMQTLASKPIRRSDILLGKWLGHAVIVAAYVLMLIGGVVLVVRTIGGFVPVNLARAVPLILLEMLLLMTISVAGGTRLSTVTNGIMALGFYGVAFVGGWMEQVGAVVRIDAARTVGIAASLISPADALWRLATYYLQPDVVRDVAPMIFVTLSVPTPLMVWWAIGVGALIFAWALRSFEKRAL
jgi:Cu-processing system permease protein